MQDPSEKIITIVVVFSTLLLLVFGAIIVRYIFLFQRKRYRHAQEVTDLHASFNRTLLQSKLEIQEQTLDHIAKELHANFSHLVSLININLSEILPQSADNVKDSILETKALAKQLMADLKALSASLNTDYIQHIGFEKALENELLLLGSRKKYEVGFIREGEDFRLSPDLEIILVRLCQEVLNNIIKHAKASAIMVGLIYYPDHFKLEITDDGIGFDVESTLSQASKGQSTGLLNISRRARLIKGDVVFTSRPSAGTSVVITIPKHQQMEINA